MPHQGRGGTFLSSIWHYRCVKAFVSWINVPREAFRNSLTYVAPVLIFFIALLSAFMSVNV